METEKYIEDVKRYDSSVNTALVEKLVSRLSVVLGNRDAALVSCGDDSELQTVKNSFVKGKLGIDDDEKIDAALKAVCEKMSGDKMKSRVTFYYLVAKELGAEETYINL